LQLQRILTQQLLRHRSTGISASTVETQDFTAVHRFPLKVCINQIGVIVVP
jgi:hypothetical protein